MMRQPLALLLLLLSASFPPAASFPPEAAPDPDTFLLLKLGEGKEGIVGAQLAVGEDLAELTSNQLQIQSDYNEVQLNTNTKTNTILNTIEAMAVRETSHRHHDDLLEITKNGLDVNQKALDILDQIRDQAPDDEGRKCVKKVMMREETVYEEVMTCHHSYDERCHDSYITTYEPHQVSEFDKICAFSDFIVKIIFILFYDCCSLKTKKQKENPVFPYNLAFGALNDRFNS